MLAASRVSAIAMSRCCTRLPISDTTAASCDLRSRLPPSANTRTGAAYLRMRSTRPASWNSAPNTVFMKPSTISASEKSLRSARFLAATVEFSAATAQAGGAAQAMMMAASAAGIGGKNKDRRKLFMAGTLAQRNAAQRASKRPSVQHHHGGADGDTIIEIDHVLIGHAEAAGGDGLSDRLRLVGAVDTIERRAEIERPRPERVLDTATHVSRQIGPARDHLPRRRPVGPFPLGRNAVHPAPAEAVAADPDAVAQRLALSEHQIEPPLGGVDDDGAGRIAGGVHHGLARDRARAAAEEIRAAAHDVAVIPELGLSLARRCHQQHCNNCANNPHHCFPQLRRTLLGRLGLQQEP